MPETPELKKLVVEIRYKPFLDFYGRIDNAGMALVDTLPDWSRAPLALQLRKGEQRLVTLTANRSAIVCQAFDNPVEEFDFAIGSLAKISPKLNLQRYTRVGVRLWHVADIGKSFDELIELVYKKLFRAPVGVEPFQSGVRDLSYVVYLKDWQGWSCNIRLGPMKRDEWFSPQHGIMQAEHREASAIYRESLPEQFLLVDLDYFCHDVQRHKLSIDAIHSRGCEMAKELVNHCQGA